MPILFALKFILLISTGSLHVVAKSCWELKDGGQIQYVQKKDAGKRYKYLCFQKDSRSAQNCFEFAAWHNGYDSVQAYSSIDEKVIWLVDTRFGQNKRGPSYDRELNLFSDEQEYLPMSERKKERNSSISPIHPDVVWDGPQKLLKLTNCQP